MVVQPAGRGILIHAMPTAGKTTLAKRHPYVLDTDYAFDVIAPELWEARKASMSNEHLEQMACSLVASLLSLVLEREGYVVLTNFHPGEMAKYGIEFDLTVGVPGHIAHERAVRRDPDWSVSSDEMSRWYADWSVAAKRVSRRRVLGDGEFLSDAVDLSLIDRVPRAKTDNPVLRLWAEACYAANSR